VGGQTNQSIIAESYIWTMWLQAHSIFILFENVCNTVNFQSELLFKIVLKYKNMPVITTSVCCHSLHDRQPKVPTAPRSVRVTNATSTSLHVTWSAPRPSRGPLVAYRVTYWTGSGSPSDDNARAVLVNDVINHDVTITSLTPYTKYYLTVCMMMMTTILIVIL